MDFGTDRTGPWIGLIGSPRLSENADWILIIF